jgi:cytochrome c-type biogenesis protein CcmH
MIWIALGLMLLAATLVVAWPLYRRQRRLTPPLVGAVLTILVVSAVVYIRVGTPVPPEMAESVDAMVASLAARLGENPNDVDGWKMLGRSYVQLQRYDEAQRAFRRAVDLESAGNAQTLADLGEAMILSESGRLTEQAGQLFDNAIALEPTNPKALFYGGIAAIERGNRTLAADRWDALLALSPPPEIQEILRQRVAEWRGATVAPSPAPAAAGESRTIITANVSLSTRAAAESGPGATVFIIARDPEQPSPPVAVARRKVSELPASIALDDGDAMIPGRQLSAFERLEILARVSSSGEPTAQPGDWYGAQIVSVAEEPSVNIIIGQQVP